MGIVTTQQPMRIDGLIAYGVGDIALMTDGAGVTCLTYPSPFSGSFIVACAPDDVRDSRQQRQAR